MQPTLFSLTNSDAARPCSPAVIRRSRGVSLIEVLIAIVVIGVACVGAFAAFSTGLGSVGKQGNRRAALERARERLEQLLSAPLTDMPRADGNLYWCTAGTTCTSTSWTFSNSALDAVPMNVDGNDRKAQVFAQWVDDPTNGVGPREIIQIGVKVWYMPGSVDDDFNRVYLKTLRTP